MLDKTTRIFNSPFHFYFDRSDNFNCYVSFNVYEFLKNYSTYPETYEIEEFYTSVRDSIKLDFYLYIEDKDSIRLHTEQQIKISNVQEISLVDSNKIKTYFLNIETENIYRDYRVKGVVTFSDTVYDYIQKFIQKNISLEIFPEIYKIKDSYEKKYYNLFSVFVPNSTHEFYSEVISFYKKSVKVSNLYQIFNSSITKQSLLDYIEIYEKAKGLMYDGNLPITSYYVDNKVYSLNYNVQQKEGNTNDYLRLSMSLLNNLKNRDDYKKFSFNNNVYLLNELTTRKKIKTVNLYQTISAIQSDACENQIQNSKTPELPDSDILLITTFFDNFPIINVNDFWAEDPKRISVYLLDLLTKYNIFYLSNIQESTLDESWKNLTKEELQNLNSGRYLCMISADQDYIQDSIIENYFVLEI